MPSRRSSQFAAWDRLATSCWTHRSRGGGGCRIILVCIGSSLMPHGTKLLIRDVRCYAASGGKPKMVAQSESLRYPEHTGAGNGVRTRRRGYSWFTVIPPNSWLAGTGTDRSIHSSRLPFGD